jgi:ferrous iron transport protein A
VSTEICPDVLLPLERLAPGDHAEVIEVSGEPAWVGRLAELGVRPGSLLRLLRGGSPCLIQVGGSSLSLRGEQTLQILVRLCS